MCQGQCHTSFVFNVLSKLFLALVLMPRFIARGRGYAWFVRVYKIPRSGIPHTSNAGCATLLVVFGECKYEHAGCATLRAWPLVDDAIAVSIFPLATYSGIWPVHGGATSSWLSQIRRKDRRRSLAMFRCSIAAKSRT